MVVTTVWVGSGQLVKHAYIEKKKRIAIGYTIFHFLLIMVEMVQMIGINKNRVLSNSFQIMLLQS